MSNLEKKENTYEDDDYGFFCDLESQEVVEYYVITKKTHYEVRRKSVLWPKINGPQRTHIIDLSSAKSSTDNLEFISESSTLKGNPYSILTFALGLRDFLRCAPANPISYAEETPTVSHPTFFTINCPKNICYPLFMCCTALSCAYFIITLPDVKKSPN